MGRAMVAGGKPAMEAPVSGIQLGTIAEGQIVKINENGSPVEFYVACHDYEPTLNGSGRTLLVRKDVHTTAAWNANNLNTYADSTIDVWFCDTYKALLDTDVQTAIEETEFYYTPGYGVYTLSTLKRSVFALSMTELGESKLSTFTEEGSSLPIASILRQAYKDGAGVSQWSRTPCNVSGIYTYYLTAGGYNGYYTTIQTHGYRPCFTLPATALFDKNTLEFKEVA